MLVKIHNKNLFQIRDLPKMSENQNVRILPKTTNPLSPGHPTKKMRACLSLILVARKCCCVCLCLVVLVGLVSFVSLLRAVSAVRFVSLVCLVCVVAVLCCFVALGVFWFCGLNTVEMRIKKSARAQESSYSAQASRDSLPQAKIHGLVIPPC